VRSGRGRPSFWGVRSVSRSRSRPTSLVGSTVRLGRGGLVTTPVGRVSTGPAAPVVTGTSRRCSRPFQTRERRNSRSSGTPGLRSAAPVLLSGQLVLRGLSARATVPGRAFPPGRFSRCGRMGTSPTGLFSTTRRLQRSSATRGRGLSRPKSLRFTVVTPRQRSRQCRSSWSRRSRWSRWR